MACKICSNFSSSRSKGPGHENTPEHQRNKVLFDYYSNRKHYVSNRRGIIVSCNVVSSFSKVVNSLSPEVKISVKPNEEVCFNFFVYNESREAKIVLSSAKAIFNKLNFVLENNKYTFPLTTDPKQKKSIMSVKFCSGDVGQYVIPLVFLFAKSSAPKDTIIYIREIVVYVELQNKPHEKVVSPYKEEDLKADKLIRGNNIRPTGDSFGIPKLYKKLYAAGLKVRDGPDSEKEQVAANQIKESFDMGVTKDNYCRLFHNLLWYEETIVRINLKKYNMSNVKLDKRGNTYILYVPGLAEKRPSLMIGDLVFVKPHELDEVMFEAAITNIDDNYASLDQFASEFTKFYERHETFDIRFFMCRLPMERMHIAVDTVVKNNQLHRVFPVRNTSQPTIKHITDFFNPLIDVNPEQSSAVSHVVSGSSGTAPYLLHGPPGTGKTFTVVETVLQLVRKNPSYRILVCTDSNMAADHVACLISDYAQLFDNKLLLRANSEHRVWEALPEKLQKYSNGRSRKTFELVSITDFMSFNVVVTTLSHAAKFARQLQQKKYERGITHLFIDEAGQASEPSSLIPVCGLLRSEGTLVLAGDPLQLGPVIISHAVRNLPLGKSLMERLMTTFELYKSEDPHYGTMLLQNFRSNPDILKLPNELFYGGKLKSCAGLDALSNTNILTGKHEKSAIVFHGVLSKEQRMGKSPSYFNMMELEVVQMYIIALIKERGVKQHEIGVVAPYIRQVYHINKWLSKNNYHEIEVGTVEAFQGKEKRVIIISTVRANCNLLQYDAKFQLGFLVDDKRFNVAITRAKAKLIVIGNPICLEQDTKWRAYLQQCRDGGAMHGFDSPPADKHQVVDEVAPLLQHMKLEEKSRN